MRLGAFGFLPGLPPPPFLCEGGMPPEPAPHLTPKAPPPTAPDDSCSASVFIWTDATEPLVQLAQPLCSGARLGGAPLSPAISQTSFGGRTLSEVAPHQRTILFTFLFLCVCVCLLLSCAKTLAKCLICKSQSEALQLRSCLGAMHISAGSVRSHKCQTRVLVFCLFFFFFKHAPTLFLRFQKGTSVLRFQGQLAEIHFVPIF